MSAAEWTDPLEIAALEIPAGATILVRLPEEPISAARAQAIHEQASATFPGHRVVMLGPGLELEVRRDREEILAELEEELAGDVCARTHDRSELITNPATRRSAAERIVRRLESLGALRFEEASS